MAFLAAPRDVLIGTVCVRATCSPADKTLNCALPSSGIGHCYGDNCVDVDVDTDPNNCGYLGGACGPGASCVAGDCVVSGLACTSSFDCLSGQFCLEGSCAKEISCSPDTCPVGLSCDTTLDNSRCDLPACGAGDDYHLCQANPSPYLGWPDFCCNESCVSLLFDRNNCGYCGHVCPSNAPCYAGACEGDCSTQPDNTPCNSAELSYLADGFCCAGLCTTSAGAATCSACGVGCSSCVSSACPAGEACVGSTQVCEPTACNADNDGSLCATTDAESVVHEGSCCGGSCTHLGIDGQNCGACGRACPQDQACLGSVCVPDASCAGQSEGALCHLASGDAGRCCGESCVDFASDNANCNGCGLACPVSTTCTPAPWSVDQPVRAGQCQDAGGVVSAQIIPSSCAGLADSTNCDTGSGLGHCCAGTCTDLSTDSNNCAVCGVACPSGTTCTTSNFQSPTTTCVSAPDEPQGCGSLNACPAGTNCLGTYCLPTSCSGLSNGDICAFGTFSGSCCGGQCVSTEQDANNCGGCGLPCDGGLCLSGVCETTLISGCVPSCPSGTLCYQMASPYGEPSPVSLCVGPVCGHREGEAFWLNSERCLAGDQQLGTCCADGSCVDIATDPENCGACGTSCHGQVCVGGTCLLAACDFKSQNGFCGTAGDLTSLCCGTDCVDTATDNDNCGRCGLVCRGGESCQDGTCQ